MSWPSYGTLAPVHAARLRRERPGIPVVSGAGRVFPTRCEELADARAAARVEDLVPLALRRWRRRTRLSQRGAAAALGLPASRIWRAETVPSVLKLGDVLTLLREAGYDLRLVSADGTPFGGDLRAEEVLPLTAAGRRFAAAADVVPLTREPRWMAERGQAFRSSGPQWTGETRPGQYP